MRGVVVKNTGSRYVVRCDDGTRVPCSVKGTFRIKGIRSTNPVAVGDYVDIKTDDGETGLITSIADRRNYIVRRSQNLSKQCHVIAANVDQALLVVTVNRPETSLVFVDRFLASAEAYSVPVVLVFNKTDLLTKEERGLQEDIMYLYDTVGYRCVALSAATGEGLERLLPLLTGKVSLLSGNSGTGKSTLVNAIVPGTNLQTGEISAAHNRGTHTTTFSEMIEFVCLQGQTPGAPVIKPVRNFLHEQPAKEENGNTERWSALIDTPGIKGFGNFDMKPEEISCYFKEIFRFSKNCRFHNCTHTHEPGCAVLQALEEHYIAQSRYNSYLSMLAENANEKYRAPQ